MDSLRPAAAAHTHMHWPLDGRPSPNDPQHTGYSSALSSPSTPQPPPQQQQQQQHIPRLAPTQPLNINRRQARLAQLAPSSTSNPYDTSADGDYTEITRSLLRDRDPLPPPSGAPPPPPVPPLPQAHHRSTSNLPATASAVPPPRPPRPPIGLGITTPVQPPASSQLLSPISPHSASTANSGSSGGRHRPSSRRALTRALELAQEAVEFDKLSDAQRAVDAYGKSVALLGEVMERVMSGGEGVRGGSAAERERERGGRRRSVSARDEEVKRLRAIHDTYADRMRILCVLHAVQPSSALPAYIQNILTPTSATFPPDPSPPPAELDGSASTAAAAIGSTFVALGEDGDLGEPVSPDEEGGAGMGRSGATTPSGLVLAPARAAPQLPHITSHPPSRPHSRSASHSHSPSPAPTLTAPAQPQTGRSIPPARPPPATSLPPIPPDVSSAAPTQPKRSPTLKQQHSMSSLRESFLPALSIAPGSPTTPTPSSSSPPRKPSITTRQARSSSLSVRTNPMEDVPPVPPLPPMPVAGEKSPLVSNTTNQGAIAQRRRAGGSTTPNVPTIKLPPSQSAQPQSQLSQPARPPTAPAAGPSLRAPSQSLPPARLRAVSQPGQRPPLASSISSSAGIPDVPSLSRTGSSSALSSIQGTPAALPVPLPPSTTAGPTLAVPGGAGPSTPVPMSPLPLPSDLALRPFHIMRSLLLSMRHPPGFYLTPRLFIPTALWSQGGAKLLSLPQKTAALLTLAQALDELHRASDERERERRGGWGMEGAGSEERWERALAEWERVCEGVRESTRGKGGKGFAGLQQVAEGKGGAGKEGKGIGAWGGRLGRQLEKMTNGKNLDSPAAYVQSLIKLFAAAPILETHLKSLLHPSTTPSSAPQYSHLTPAQRAGLEQRLRRSAEFFAGFVVPFVVKDLGLLMEKYLKKGEKWLVE